MPSAPRRTAHRLSVLVAVLMAVVSGAGLFFHELYQDNALIASSWYGNDLVTLVVATPLLGVALLGAWGGSRRAFLVWMGLVAYSLYNSAFYLFRATFNSLFLVYALLFTLSSFAVGLLAASWLWQQRPWGYVWATPLYTTKKNGSGPVEVRKLLIAS